VDQVEDDSSPIATLRQLNRALPEEYLKLMEMLIERPVICHTPLSNLSNLKPETLTPKPSIRNPKP
jgi:hypothetical protein